MNVSPDDFYISFYTNKIKNYDKVTLDNILRYNNKQLEDKHNFIQYLFPLETKSKYNPKAPVITDRFIKEAKKNKEIKSNIVRSFARMMNFYGFNIIKDSEGIHLEIDPKGDFQWMTRGNHNYMRISRMLTFLQMIDMHLLAYMFFDILCELYPKGKIEKSTFEVWRDIIKN